MFLTMINFLIGIISYPTSSPHLLEYIFHKEIYLIFCPFIIMHIKNCTCFYEKTLINAQN